MMKTIASVAAVVFIAVFPLTAGVSESAAAGTDDSAKARPSDGKEAPESAAALLTTDPKDSALVRASKAAKAANAAKPKSDKPVKVITNADVKKSKGKLTVLPPRPDQVDGAPGSGPSAGTGSGVDGMTGRQARDVAELRKRAADLESALNRLEDEYYQSDDPAYRDGVIKKKFDETKKELDRSRAELSKVEHTAGDKSSPSPTSPRG
jgi:hypothetical protein